MKKKIMFLHFLVSMLPTFKFVLLFRYFIFKRYLNIERFSDISAFHWCAIVLGYLQYRWSYHSSKVNFLPTSKNDQSLCMKWVRGSLFNNMGIQSRKMVFFKLVHHWWGCVVKDCTWVKRIDAWAHKNC